jgi:hypothetical protein
MQYVDFFQQDSISICDKKIVYYYEYFNIKY